MSNTTQIVWEILNAAVYDLCYGAPEDGINALEEAIALLGKELEAEAVAHSVPPTA
jgi:hypothetical protein